MKRPQIETAVFVGLGVGVAAVTHSPALALVAGFVVTLLRRREVDHLTGRAAKSLLQVSVILLGYGLSLQTVWEVGRGSFAITAMSLCITLSLGWLIGRLYRLEKPLSTLISGGTAICGGSAIAALAPAIGAPIGQVGIALTVVFLLNGVALVVFPMIGHWLGMSEVTFGLWSALAIHDTSSVVGAGAAFGAIALAVGTTVKLTRAMWILPVAAISSHLHKGAEKRKWYAAFPVFLLGFVIAAATHSLAPEHLWLWDGLASAGKRMMLVSLFLVGMGLSWQELRKAGLRPMLAGTTLWICVSMITLACIESGLWHIEWH